MKRNLEILYSEKELDKEMRRYRKKKILLMVGMVVSGLLFGFMLKEKEQNTSPWMEGAVIQREAGLQTTIDMVAEYQGETYELPLMVTPRRLTEQELDTLYEEFKLHLWELICQENASPKHVVDSLLLMEEYEGYPFLIEWESDCPQVMSQWGDYGGPEITQEVTLTAHLFYEEYERTCTQSIQVCSPEDNEYQWKKKGLQQLLADSQKIAVEKDRWQLPLEWKGAEIIWSPRRSHMVWKALVCCLVLGVFLGFAMDRDLEEQVKQRRRQVRDAYPGLLHQLILYMGAGMTIRGSFERIVIENENAEKKDPFCEQIRQMLRKLQAGMPEGRVYEDMGRQLEVQEYIKLGNLLSQNLKHGNRYLLDRIREEGDRAWEERLLEIRKKGEEAGTKLLLPMVLLLAVTLVIIVLPAFLKM